MPRSAAPLLLLLGSLAVLGGCRGPEPPPNVLLISVDSLRADRLGAWGNPRDTSPTLDRLAAEGVRFANAVSPTSWTLPAHVSMLTGLAQRRHGVVQFSDVIPTDVPLVSETFASNGWTTVGFYSGPFLHPAYGFGRGFAQWISCQSADISALHGPGSWAFAHLDETNPNVLRAWKRWLSHDAREPFFAFVHLWDVHYDYIPPEPYRSRYDPSYRGRLDGRGILGPGFPLTASPRDVAHLLALYDGEVRYTDDTIARMLALLEREGLLDRTIVVVTADHGDEFLEHGYKGHQKTLYQEVIHVPLILWARRGVPRGRTVTRPVSLEDVSPTLLDLAGLPALPETDGRSLMSLARGDAGATHPPVVSALYADTAASLVLAAIRDGTTKVTYEHRKHTRVRYDLSADPRERAPMPVEEDDALVVALMERVDLALATLLARNETGARLPPDALPAPEVERLRALGYLQ